MTMLDGTLHTIDRVTGVVDKLVQVAVVTIFVVIFALLNLQVAMRYVMGIPMIWLEELAGFLMAYLTLWGSSSCIRSDGHVRVSFLPDRMKSPVSRRWLSIVIHAILLFYLFYLIVYGYRFAAMGHGELTPSGTFDFFLPRLALTTGGILMAVQAAGVIVREAVALAGGSVVSDE